MAEVKITTDNFEAEVLGSDKPVLVDFWATWCGPCQMVAPELAAIAEEHPEIKVGKVNVDEEPMLAMKYGVSSIPMMVLFKNGEPAQTLIGARPKNEIVQLMGL
ncbi:MAG: thioredoxin [Firmicutes bacterium]|nr:thioredoxin [Bacillota bacterium]